MKDWEVEKVNELYKELDRIKAENKMLQELAECKCDCKALIADVKDIKELLGDSSAKRTTKKK